MRACLRCALIRILSFDTQSMRAKLYRLLCTMQAKLDAFFAPPASVRGMRQLDKAAFRREVTLPAVFLHPSLCSKFLNRLRHVVLRYPRIGKIQTHVGGEEKKEEKVLLLMPSTCLETPVSEEDLKWITDNEGRRGFHSLTLEYQHYTARAILTAVLPKDVKEIPTGFEVVGHIAHFNLRNEFLPYKTLIGEVMLDQQSSIRSVVNKTDSIDNTFRFFKMELLAGEDNMVTTVHESGCLFTFDFSKVYWNSRLHTEHERVVGLMKKGEVAVDVFSGVGPFSIPAAKKGCTVYANDLNPHSYEALVENSKRNNISRQLHAFNMDGREFLQEIIPKLVNESLSFSSTSTAPVICSHIIMNLPAAAVLFLGSLRGLYSSVPHNKRDSIVLPTVHCYCFSKTEQPDKQSLEMVEKNLGTRLAEGTYTVYNVRHVAPNKLMMRVSFTLPPHIAFSDSDRDMFTAGEDHNYSEPDPKRRKTE